MSTLRGVVTSTMNVPKIHALLENIEDFTGLDWSVVLWLVLATLIIPAWNSFTQRYLVRVRLCRNIINNLLYSKITCVAITIYRDYLD